MASSSKNHLLHSDHRGNFYQDNHRQQQQHGADPTTPTSSSYSPGGTPGSHSIIVHQEQEQHGINLQQQGPRQHKNQQSPLKRRLVPICPAPQYREESPTGPRDSRFAHIAPKPTSRPISIKIRKPKEEQLGAHRHGHGHILNAISEGSFVETQCKQDDQDLTFSNLETDITHRLENTRTTEYTSPDKLPQGSETNAFDVAIPERKSTYKKVEVIDVDALDSLENLGAASESPQISALDVSEQNCSPAIVSISDRSPPADSVPEQNRNAPKCRIVIKKRDTPLTPLRTASNEPVSGATPVSSLTRTSRKSLIVAISTKKGTCRIMGKRPRSQLDDLIPNLPSEIPESPQAGPRETPRVKRIKLKSKAVSSPPITRMATPFSSPSRRQMSMDPSLQSIAPPPRLKLTLKQNNKLVQQEPKAPPTPMPAMNDLMYKANCYNHNDTQEDAVPLKVINENQLYKENSAPKTDRSRSISPAYTEPYCYCHECAEKRKNGLLPDISPPQDIALLRQDSDETLLKELEAAEASMRPEFRSGYFLINKAGFGAFSSVFAAIDLRYDHCSNHWDVFTPSRKSSLHFVAIKMIRGGSSPARIQNELELLKDLRGCPNVISLITADRCQDNVFVVLPYCSQTPIKEIYENLTPKLLKSYMKELLLALSFVHGHGIIHRDIKSTNFLYSIRTGRGVLADFGLAEREKDNFKSCECQRGGLSMRDYHGLTKQGGYYLDDPRPHRYASRVGTRGFRAPEVLLKCGAQDTRLDMWSAGVLLLSLLSGRLCFFRAEEDREGLLEQAVIFGARRMRKCAILHGSIFESNVPSITDDGVSFEEIISRCRKDESVVEEFKDAIDLAKRLLELDVRKRFTAKRALGHPFITL